MTQHDRSPDEPHPAAIIGKSKHSASLPAGAVKFILGTPQAGKSESTARSLDTPPVPPDGAYSSETSWLDARSNHINAGRPIQLGPNQQDCTSTQYLLADEASRTAINLRRYFTDGAFGGWQMEFSGAAAGVAPQHPPYTV